MSADNWAVCPRCYSEATAAAAAQRGAVMATYGSVPVEEFDAARRALKEVNPGDFETFREDYEFYGAPEGVVVASYDGQCTECGLSATLRASKRFWPAEEAS